MVLRGYRPGPPPFLQAPGRDGARDDAIEGSLL